MKLYVQPSKFVDEALFGKNQEIEVDWGPELDELADKIKSALKSAINIYVFDKGLTVAEFADENAAFAAHVNLKQALSFEGNIAVGAWVNSRGGYNSEKFVVFHLTFQDDI